ncbi:hypothetical protein BC939DRAFT_495623 [Gamsiella multidivaricata]|uniref:uncharacterized protein n=1 Tax=Gamsiella multidivaricata TaxID=101098 RepID=UPI00221FF015|nr:uncharacterized protein BC939DRAFT_495623 [Gamsiella multidivaricata]KAI7818966.1 hypothetical protein BC939DRAFT_495623 [Gamsiella multidivaricata]
MASALLAVDLALVAAVVLVISARKAQSMRKKTGNDKNFQASGKTSAESTGFADCTAGESTVAAVSIILWFDGALSLYATDAMVISFLLASRKPKGGMGSPTAPRCSNSRMFILLKPCTFWIKVFDTVPFRVALQVMLLIGPWKP